MLRKRIMIAVIALAMLILVMSNVVFAESQLTVTAGKTEINKGTTSASVTLTLSGNPGIWGIQFDIGYNSSVMKLESVSLSEEVFPKGAIMPGESLDLNPYPYVATNTELDNISANGLLATLNFTVNSDCPAGTYPITLSNSVCGDYLGNYITTTLVAGSITVKDPFAGMAAKVVKDGTETGYATLDAAVSSAASGSTVHVLADTTLIGCTIDKTLTIDGGGKKVRVINPDDIDASGAKSTINITANGDVTLKDITITRTDKLASYAVLRVTAGKLTLGSGTTISKVSGGNGSAIYVDDGGDVGVGVINMEEGSLIDSCYSGVLGAECKNWSIPSIFLEGGTFNMNGGEIKGCVAPASNKPSAILLQKANAIVNLKGGTITGNSGGVGAIGVNAGTLNVCAGANVTNNGGVNIKKMADTAKINVDGGKMTGNVSAADTMWVDDKYVASNGTTFYEEVWKAVYSVKDGSTVYLLKDAEFKTPSAAEVTAEETATGVDISSGTNLDRNQNLVFDGQGHTLKMTGAKSCSATLTFKNVTMDIKGSTYANNGAFRWFGGTLTFGDGCTVVGKEYTDDDKNAGNPGGYLLYLAGGTANIEEGCVIRDNKRVATNGVFAGAIYVDGQENTSPILNMKGGKITGCRASEGGAIFVKKGTFNMTGGEITGNLGWSGSGIRAYYANAVLNISGDAKVYNNSCLESFLEYDNIRANTYTALNIDKAFTGKIGFMFDGVTKDNAGKNVLNTKIGTIAGNLTLASVDSVVCDYDDTLFAYVSGTDLILTKKLTLTPVTDQGKYTKTGDTYGVVRVNTTVTEVPLADSVEEMGTYFYVGDSNPGVVDNANKSNCYKPVITDLASGRGYTADLVDIEGETATVYAVNFYKLKGIGEYVFEAPVEVEYVKANAKNLGKDPVQLKDN